MPIKGVLSKAKVPVKIWTDINTVESAALDQLTNVANLPFVYKHVAVMPDVHVGKGATVGSVIATKNALIPAAVGVDIGCGMMAVRTHLNPKRVQDKAAKVRKAIEDAIPVGYQGNKYLPASVKSWKGWDTYDDLCPYAKDVTSKARSQLGSLGGGNHFIEICTDEENNLWVMLHSGSRNIGKTIADWHMHEAKELMKKFHVGLSDRDLAFLPGHTSEFDAYVHDLLWCQDYALQNRVEMMNRVLDILSDMFCEGNPVKREFEVNCHHNYAEIENHYGKNVWVTRKGAVRARTSDYGIIPGSMGAKSYIVMGKGNEESFCSCSHGAGRKMSRSKAKEKFTRKDLMEQTKGVECRKDSGVIDEIPAAYKDIDRVMENQNDLVTVVATLKQFICIKG